MPSNTDVLRLTLLLLVALQQLPTFRTEVRVVRVDAEVRQGNYLIETLTQQDFRITDGGKPQEIVHFGYSEESLDLILLFDTSGSMQPAIEQVSRAARTALDELQPNDRIAVMAFDTVTDLIADFTSDRNAVDATIRNRVLSRAPGRRTRLQGAVSDASRYFLRQAHTDRRRAILVVTDNMGTSRGEGGAADLWDADTVVSAVVVPGMVSWQVKRAFFPPTWFGFGSIDGVVAKSGGEMLKGEDIADNFRQLIHRLRRRYVLHYAMPKGKPGQERSIRVELSRDAASRYPGALIRARKGYVAPAS